MQMFSFKTTVMLTSYVTAPLCNVKLILKNYKETIKTAVQTAYSK